MRGRDLLLLLLLFWIRLLRSYCTAYWDNCRSCCRRLVTCWNTSRDRLNGIYTSDIIRQTWRAIKYGRTYGPRCSKDRRDRVCTKRWCLLRGRGKFQSTRRFIIINYYYNRVYVIHTCLIILYIYEYIIIYNFYVKSFFFFHILL